MSRQETFGETAAIAAVLGMLVWGGLAGTAAEGGEREGQARRPDKKAERTAREIRKLVGAPARFVWLEANRAYYYTRPGRLSFLAGVDTEDGGGGRRLLKDPGAYSKPVFTPDGSGVVFTDLAKGRVFLVGWSDGKVRDLGKGFASDVWCHPKTGVDWVYLRRGAGKTSDPIVRRRLDDPKVEEMVWDRTKNGQDYAPWFQMSRDGKRFSDAFPWNRCGIGNLQTMDWKHYDGGCWPSMAFDESYRIFVFSGSHESIRLYQENNKKSRSISLSTVPGKKGEKVYFPRWSNDPRFLTVSAPKGGTSSKIYIGKFDDKWESIEKWVKVSGSPMADIFGDAWIKPPEKKPSLFSRMLSAIKSKPKPDKTAGESAVETWPGSTDELMWVWEQAKAKNEAPALEGETRPFACQGLLRGRARFGRHFELLLDGGNFEAGEEAGARIASACRASQSLAMEAIITPDHVDQAGSRAIVSLPRASGGHNLLLSQKGDRLILRFGEGKEKNLARLEVGKPAHLIVTHDPSHTVCYLNGKRVFTEKEKAGADFGNWEPGLLLFGGERDAETDWEGSLQRIAIYGRGIGPDEAASLSLAARAYLESQSPPSQRWSANATLVEATRIPSLGEIDTYRRALVESVYEIDQVVEGTIPDGVEKKIVVLQWVIMDRRPLPSNGELKIGATRRLTLELREAHPALESEFRSSDHSEFLLPVFFDVNSHR